MPNDKTAAIIGITGTLGAGKGTVVEFLVKNKGFLHFSVRGYLVDELVRRGMPVNRDAMVELANELRANNNPAFIVEELLKKASRTGANSIIESIRTPGEIAALRKHPGFVLLAVDANARTRYERILLRNSETDRISFETFIDNENREMYAIDPNKQNLSACIIQADFLILNDKSLNTLHGCIEKFIKKFRIL